MKILVTGSKGFVGKNVIRNLIEIKNGNNKTRPNIHIEEIFECDRQTSHEDLIYACTNADFVLHFAGVNRPINTNEFKTVNTDFTEELLKLLSERRGGCPVLLSSSIQASLTGRFKDSEYGKSKLEAEQLTFKYGQKTGSKVFVYRFPNLFGKWCKPNYNSVIATFCNAVANDLQYTVNDPDIELELLYIDDLVEGVLDALEGKEQCCEYNGLIVNDNPKGKYCYIPITHKVTLGHIVETLKSFKTSSRTYTIPDIPNGSFEKKLLSTYLTYLPAEKFIYPLDMKIDNRGSFTELLKTKTAGQISVNITRPGVTKGEHWHNSKWEIFMVVSGHGLIQERRIGTDPNTGKPYPVIEFEVNGEQIKAIQMIPGYTHNIKNLSDTQDLVTVMWANEQFNPERPDTFHEIV